jgi:hypothetical protein
MVLAAGSEQQQPAACWVQPQAESAGVAHKVGDQRLGSSGPCEQGIERLVKLRGIGYAQVRPAIPVQPHGQILPPSCHPYQRSPVGAGPGEASSKVSDTTVGVADEAGGAISIPLTTSRSELITMRVRRRR